MPSPLDLTQMYLVKSWLSANGLPPANTSDDINIQACITSFSSMFIWRTGKGPLDGSEPNLSPYLTPVTYNEIYDGNGSFRMFLRNRPIQSVSSLVIGNQTIPASTGWGVPGYLIDGSKASVSLQGNGGGGSVPYNFWNLGGCGTGFWEGVQNVSITYTAGYIRTNLTQTSLVLGGTGYNIGDTFTINGGATLATGLVLTVNGGAVVTYLISSIGTGYTTSIANTVATSGSGIGLVLSLFVGPNDDIELAARRECSLAYKRRSWIGLNSAAMAQGAGTTSYWKGEMDPETERLIINYTNWSVV